jgi:hypothetical protein
VQLGEEKKTCMDCLRLENSDVHISTVYTHEAYDIIALRYVAKKKVVLNHRKNGLNYSERAPNTIK